VTEPDRATEKLLAALHERAKELHTLYRVDEILNRQDGEEAAIYADLVATLPPGWQFPDVCEARIVVEGGTYRTSGYRDTPWVMSAPITVQGDRVGEVAVCYTEERPSIADGSPFLLEEQRLIDAIAERIGLFLVQQRLRSYHESWQSAVQELSASRRESLPVLLDFLHRSDPGLLRRITRKMINHLYWNGVRDAAGLLQENVRGAESRARETDENRPLERQAPGEQRDLTRRTFEIALGHLSEEEIVRNIQSWISEENATFLIKLLESPDTSLGELAEGVRRFQSSAIDESELSTAVHTNLKVGLLRRFFVDQLEYINIAKRFVEVRDFYDLVQHLVHPPRSQGKLGGKAAGLFLASQVVKSSPEHRDLLRSIRVPKTWYLASDGILDFIRHNNLNEVYNRKYMEIERIRIDYPHIIQLFKNSEFTPELRKGLSAVLDDFEDRPIIVRSSSMLEDRVGSSFSGKYKSLFLANQGSKKERLDALLDAIAEVYASVFGPDPIEYRAQRGLLDFREEMAILIEEVVGTRVGRYFFPAFSGVAFSDNTLKWSPRISVRDGLVRMVPGLGTRAVDRLGDDYPALVAPGQPGLRVNVTPDEILRYSPKRMDVIDLVEGSFRTVEVRDVLRELGEDFPAARELVSVVEGGVVREPLGLGPDWANDDLVVTFEGLLNRTEFLHRIRALLELLREELGTPVDIEFAHDGTDLFLLQCRAQGESVEHAPVSIPRHPSPERVLFTARKHVPNGRVSNLTHIVYVDPQRYAELPDLAHLQEVARAVGALNQVLPKRQFVLLGPGRWGSRGDIRLGVGVTYSDINNTAVLMEVARRQGNYLPEVSFGTHFFQDLVESDIRYLPLFPDDEGVVFNEEFLRGAHNVLSELLPQYAHLEDTVRVIDLPRQTGGDVLALLMNAEAGEAIGILEGSGSDSGEEEPVPPVRSTPSVSHWRWRMRMARRVAAHLEPERFGVRALYVFGSTKNGTAGPASDIDLLVHFEGDEAQRVALLTWFEGWSRALAEMNYLRTGRPSEGLLDVVLVTDRDIEARTSYAAKIGAVTDPAQPLLLGKEAGPHPGAR